MKTVFLFLYFFVFLGGNHFLYAQEIARGDKLYQEISVEVLRPYFEALKNGDVESLRGLLAGKIYDKYKVLLEKNIDYPEFLRNHFREADFLVGKVETNGNEILVDVVIQLSGNQFLESKFLIRKEVDDLSFGTNGQGWKLMEQINQ